MVTKANPHHVNAPTPDPADSVPWLPPAMTDELQVQIHDLMVKGRRTEETLIRMVRTGQGYFWIGGPGEEAFGVAMALLLKKGYGPDYDYLHLHYRSSALVLAMGADPIDLLRQMRSTATDPYSKGRNFVNHFAIKRWNVVPVTPTIETQYTMAPGTALVQRRHGGSGLTMVNGGDAGSAEGDFWTGLNWSTRPGAELPVLMVIAQNLWGISTPAAQVQNSTALHVRASGFGMANSRVDGNDPIASFEAIREAMQYVRYERRPYCLQADLSRLYGHSSSSGANRDDEPDCLSLYEARMIRENRMTQAEIQAVHDKWDAHLHAALDVVKGEPMPDKSHVLQHVFFDGPAGN